MVFIYNQSLRIIKYILIFLPFVFLSENLIAQDSKCYSGEYGGPFVSLSKNKLGSSLAVGGGGVFIIKKNKFVGIFGQTTSSALAKESNIKGFESYNLKSRYTGLFMGYFQNLEKFNKLYLSYYTNIGFGRVYLENSSTQELNYDGSILFSPHIELIIDITSFFKIGIGGFYDIYTGVNLLSYKNTDFNTAGIIINFRFVGTE